MEKNQVFTMMTTENAEIKALHVADLQDLLEKYEQLDDFKNEKIHCQICSDIISSKNVGSVKLQNNNLVFTCSKISCYNAIIKKPNN